MEGDNYLVFLIVMLHQNRKYSEIQEYHVFIKFLIIRVLGDLATID